jgi:signal transduction histidine kinase
MNRLAVTYFEKMLHEMNGPITTIYLLSDLMLSNSNVKLDKRNNRENLRSIYEAAKKLNKMVNLLSTITNFQSDTINIQLNKCDLIELVKEEVKYHQVRNKNSSLILKFQNRTSSYYSIVDNFWFKQLLGILITNAMNHTEKGVIKIRVGIIKDREH